jgi:membrane peptidoglycan carboxypeptidase
MFNYPRRNRTGLRRWLPSFKQLLILGVLGVAGLFVTFGIAVRLAHIPDPSEVSQAQATILYFDDGKTELARLGEANRVALHIDQIPLTAQRAVLAAEDRQFYSHGGFSPKGIGRAIFNNLTGSSTQGGSTITQQYAKNAYLTSSRTVTRKLKELVLSIKLETANSKDQILERYLNTIYFGRGAYGIESASNVYFGRTIGHLSIPQQAVLAAIIQAPNGLAPETNKSGLKARWNYVLNGMVTQGWLDRGERNKMVFPKIKPYKLSDTYGGSRGYLVEQTRKALVALGITEDQINRSGFKVVTTFNRRAQAAAVAAVNAQGPKSGTQGLRIGIASVRPSTGEVVAIYGGADFLQNQVNNATQAIGQAGSTFKPFALAAGLENKIQLNDTFSGVNGTYVGNYRVVNYSNESFGSSITMLRATEQSVNTAYEQMTARIGPDKVKDALIRAGIPDTTAGLDPNVTITLGTASPHVVDVASAYATFANRGKHVPTTYLKSVTTPDGAVKFALNPVPVKAFTARISDTVSYALQRVVQYGTGTAALALGRPAAGKTGTTDDNKSAWFAGYTPDLATAVMFVKDGPDGQPISLSGTGGMASVYGGSFPARIWTAYMQGALAGMPVSQLPRLPLNVASGNSASPSPSTSSSVNPSVRPTTTAKPRPSKSVSGKPTSQPEVSVPSLIGDIDSARAVAAGLGLTLNEVPLDETVDLTLPLYVVAQVPAQGTMAIVGSTISVQVSNSPS